jgi:hypothetical protein
MEYFTCKTCGLAKELSIDNFYRKSSNKTGYEYNCKVCSAAKKKVFRSQNKEQESIRSKNYYKENRDSILMRSNVYNKTNRKRGLERHKNRVKIDPTYRLRGLVSRAVGNALKINGVSKGGSILNYLPYTIQELKEHLEKQFEPWMTWKNQGRYNVQIWDDNDQSTWTWQLDHIISQANLPYTSMTDDNFQKCWALSNLRPLSAKQNVLDGNRKT